MIDRPRARPEWVRRDPTADDTDAPPSRRVDHMHDQNHKMTIAVVRGRPTFDDSVSDKLVGRSGEGSRRTAVAEHPSVCLGGELETQLGLATADGPMPTNTFILRLLHAQGGQERRK